MPYIRLRVRGDAAAGQAAAELHGAIEAEQRRPSSSGASRGEGAATGAATEQRRSSSRAAAEQPTAEQRRQRAEQQPSGRAAAAVQNPAMWETKFCVRYKGKDSPRWAADFAPSTCVWGRRS